MIKKRIFFLLFLCLFLGACTGSIINHSTFFPVNLSSKIAIIPFSNYTETPLAGDRAMSITAATLESGGACRVIVYHPQRQNNGLLPDLGKQESRHALLQWAKDKGARYVMTGSVNEWTYKVGLDGEPVVGLSLQLIELSTNRIVWTAVGSKSGGSRIAVSTVAQVLINALLDSLFKSGGFHAR